MGVDHCAIAANLTAGARAMLKAAHFDRYAGTWIGDGPEVDELFQAGLTDGEPEDGGGEWGRVAALNADGLAVRRIVMGVADA